MKENKEDIYRINANKIIDSMIYTIEKNRNEILELLIKNKTRKMNISFEINPDEVITMNINCEKLVVDKYELAMTGYLGTKK